MANTEFTKGKWEVDERVGCVAVYVGEKTTCLARKNDSFIHYADGEKMIDKQGFYEWNVSREKLANANLIASAPDLYEALNLLKDAINDAEINSSVKDINNALYFAEIALTKAIGGTQNGTA